MSADSNNSKGEISIHADQLMSVSDRVLIRMFFKALGLRKFQKNLPTLTYRKRAKVNRCSQQMQVFAVKLARKQLSEIIVETNERLEIADFFMLREKSKIKFQEEFDEGEEFLNQIENKLNGLLVQVEAARREGR